MNERITLVSLFEEYSLEKINKLVNKINENLCKVPFGKNVDDRIKVDTLPYHFTLFAWDIIEEEKVIEKLNNIIFPKIKVKVDSIKIMNGKENSYVLYFNIVDSDELKSLQKSIYENFTSKHYNPENFNFHITIHIDKDYEKIIKMEEALEENFEEFELAINSFALFEIYPAKLVKKF